MFTEHASSQGQPFALESHICYTKYQFSKDYMFDVYMTKFGMRNCLPSHSAINILQKMAKIDSDRSKIGKQWLQFFLVQLGVLANFLPNIYILVFGMKLK